MDTEYNYETIKALARERGCRPDDLLAMSRNHDPFYVGTPSQCAYAQWFTNLWNKYGFDVGEHHLRALHYKVVNGGEVVNLPLKITWHDKQKNYYETTTYENVEPCWDFLVLSGEWARHMGMVDPDNFIDRKNAKPIINTHWRIADNQEPDYSVSGNHKNELSWSYRLPTIPEISRLPRELPLLPGAWANGLEDIQQTYHVEIWAEKTTQNDILEPLCERYHVNLITGMGELSITAVRQFLKRVRQAGRATRILYISDFDPAGIDMPISISRKIEFYQRNDGFSDCDIALIPIVLTKEQVEYYKLPRIPVKESDGRKGLFETSFGAGQVELDALRSLYDGEIEKIVSGWIERYIDMGIQERADETRDELQSDLSDIRQAVTDEHEEELRTLRDDYQSLFAEFEKTRAEFVELVKPFTPKLEAYRERLDTIRDRAQGIYDQIEEELRDGTKDEIDLDDYPVPDPDIDGDPDEPLYSSDRDYFEQLEAYETHRTGGKNE